MRIGLLRHRVLLQRQDSVQNELGENVSDWIDVATLFAQAQPLRGSEYFESINTQQLQSTGVRFRLRYRVGITPSMRIVWDGFEHDIQAVINVQGRNREIELMTVRRGAVLPVLVQGYADPVYFSGDDYYTTAQPQHYAAQVSFSTSGYAA